MNLRKSDKFSKNLTIEVNRRCRTKKIEWCSKTRLGEKVGIECLIKDFSEEIVELFQKAREISQV